MVNDPLFAHSLYKVKLDDTFFSGGNKVASKEPLEWGLCYNKEMNSNSNTYCDEHDKNIYPCAPGVAYYGRGVLPIYWYVSFLSH